MCVGLVSRSWKFIPPQESFLCSECQPINEKGSVTSRSLWMSWDILYQTLLGKEKEPEGSWEAVTKLSKNTFKENLINLILRSLKSCLTKASLCKTRLWTYSQLSHRCREPREGGRHRKKRSHGRVPSSVQKLEQKNFNIVVSG